MMLPSILSSLYELAKMDGAIILSRDIKTILYANTQLTPDPMIPSFETGSRHRTAERVARQTGAMVIAISQRRNVITVYQANVRYILRDVSVILAKANQALQTLEKYKSVMEQALINLSALEFEDLVTLSDVVTVVQRAQMVARIDAEIERYIWELGSEGRLVSMQLEELMVNLEDEGRLVIKDYQAEGNNRPVQEIWDEMSRWSAEELLDQSSICRALGYGGGAASPENSVTPRGYRILNKIPGCPWRSSTTWSNSSRHCLRSSKPLSRSSTMWKGLARCARGLSKEGLQRLREQVLLDRHI